MKAKKIEKTRFRRALAFVLAVCLAVGLVGAQVPTRVAAEGQDSDIVISGRCNGGDGGCYEGGINLSEGISEPTAFWEVNEQGHLRIYGIGPIFSLDYYNDNLEMNRYVPYENVSSIVVEDGITGIGGVALTSLTAITELNIPDSVTYIGGDAIRGCSLLERITIGSGVERIGELGPWYDSFEQCYALTEFIVDEDNNYFSTIDGVLFNKDKTKLVCYPMGKTNTNYIVPDGVITIGAGAFGHNSSGWTDPEWACDNSYYAKYGHLTSVTLPDTVTTLETSAFEECVNLEHITLSSNLEVIGNSAFATCVNLEAPIFPDSSFELGANAFMGCLAFTSITIPGKASFSTWDEDHASEMVISCAFVHCVNLETVIIEEGVPYIPPLTFEDCTGLKNLILPDNIRLDNTIAGSAGSTFGAFRRCPALGRVNLKRGVLLGGDPFYGCDNVILGVYENSPAHEYAVANQIPFILMADVIFKSWDNTVIETQTVDCGDAATAPADHPTRAGYTFSGWDKAFDNVTSDLTVTAQYTLNDDTTIIIDRPGDYSFGNGEVTGDMYIYCDDVHIDNLVLHGNLYAAGKNIYIWGLYADGDVELNSTSSVTVWGGYSTSGYNNYGGYEGDVSFGSVKSLVTGWNSNLNTITGDLKISGAMVSVGDFSRSMIVEGDVDIHADSSVLTYVTVKGETRVNDQVKNGNVQINYGNYPYMGIYGGGSGSVHLKGVTVGSIEVNKVLKNADDQPVRVVFEDDTKAAETVVKSAAIVENDSKNGVAEKIVIETKQEVELRGSLSSVEVTDAAALTLAGDAVVNTLTITKAASGAIVSGDGKIKTVVVSETLDADTILSDMSVEKIETLKDGTTTPPRAPQLPPFYGIPSSSAPSKSSSTPTAPSVPAQTAPSMTVIPFTDISKSDWFYDDAQFVYACGLFRGTTGGTFSPHINMSRAMLVTVLYRLAVGDAALGVPNPDAAGFDDVPQGQWYSDAIAWAASLGIVTGTGDNKFAPNTEIMRQDLAVLLYRYAGSPASAASLSAFADAEAVSDYARDALAWAIAAGIIRGGDDGKIDPKASATRADAAAMLHRFVANRED